MLSSGSCAAHLPEQTLFSLAERRGRGARLWPKTVPPVDKIVGPGNIYVATAKRLVFGQVDIDMIAGPSEVLVIADDSASPRDVAADMLSQAEHDEQAAPLCITTSESLATAIVQAITDQLAHLHSSIALHPCVNRAPSL